MWIFLLVLGLKLQFKTVSFPCHCQKQAIPQLKSSLSVSCPAITFPQNLKALHAPSHQAGCRLGRETGKAILKLNVKGEELTLRHLPWWGIQRSACLKSIWAKFLHHYPSNLHCCCSPKMREQRGRGSKIVQSPAPQRTRQKQQSEAPVCWLIQPAPSHAADPKEAAGGGGGAGSMRDGSRGRKKQRGKKVCPG